MSVCVNSCVHYRIASFLCVCGCSYVHVQLSSTCQQHLFEKSFTDMNTKSLNTYEKLWLANRASHNMALAGPTAIWLASGHREARPLTLPPPPRPFHRWDKISKYKYVHLN